VSDPLARPGQVVDLRRCDRGLQAPQQLPLVRTGDVEIVQFVVPAGEELPTHEAQGEIVLHCLEGRVEVTALGVSRELRAGQLLYLAINEPFSMRGREDASLLAVIIMPRQGPAVELVGK
jgi:quercetin dioxygenase-like cupin family protein